MLRFVLTRIGLAVPTLVVVAMSVFVIIRLIPGDPAALMLGDSADAASLQALREQLGLNASLPTQFAIWAGHILGGDFGRSIANDQAVLPLIVDRFLLSAQIVLPAVCIATLIAVPAGMLAARRQGSATDFALVSISTLFLSVPAFWTGMLLLLLFAVKLEWLPVVGFVTLSEKPLDALFYLILPVLTLLLHEIGVVMRMMRASTLEVLNLDYVTHARAKGLSESKVMWRHAFKSAFGPTWTLLGLILGNLLAGIAVIETVFTIPGLGRLLVDAIFARDYPVIQGCLLFIAGIYVLVNLVVDLLYPVFDPRVVAK